ncbi:MAG: hypothetical protein A3C08_02455 [Candidatus Taylorbacteria bacterium RIFCSPHIGHO2_02_FULL_47_18]|uniref:UDP-N-acetylmuramoyl-tripeptide--D-alanyl-D-alanine ligase n=1 Tax=Candidatus Taylorbacteria bacterium RIFCSPLOWO2_01_FULL_48_100 TaxID=1802322 RepID=A0A1G2ND57_9BACT|nr:MAG: hypothetical protein A2670_03225 [Candidatus Taylorbacteria bacterium RIFCSPHIGHO2_01_FULL_48_38]OHA27567.1 MAG: hypothetical protein A3C08_02455 [Candidatus Taylorbacteria bacterium RIFCSPHIGHO2_02_FULL_47_18]OHA34006.1 MAG: hypothetical protein A2938_02465 [Candidatus Taylorbacteria bacterium RIFCSPLOWO2_01_FULL_48_100]OHA40415.1 MAG: hypothetical protein A3J31_02475 [Candidatus Taylorbacteria bacterium RIFCSPLOWO2_02_FULL_48_16]OHA44945.1 MAG: hypothetical protein A3H13_03550 [Candid
MKTFLKSIVVGILTLEARLFLARFKPFVIAVTGTVGKTSAKDAIAAALAPFASVRKSEKSYNSEIGVPLAILGARNQWNNPLGWFFVLLRGLFLLVTRYTLQVTRHPRFLVVEVGTDRPGDIRAIARWLRPTMVVVTKLSRAPVHIENFSSASELVAEKGALVSALQKDGILILNGDDADVRAFRALAPLGVKVISFGIRLGADVRAGEADLLVKTRGTIGTPMVYAGLAALAVVQALGFDRARASRALSERTLAPGRMRMLDGVNGARIIDDTYNSSPVAVAEALTALSGLETRGRRIAVLGDMLELGILSEAEHDKMVRDAVEKADIVFLVGERACAAVAAAFASGFPAEKIRTFADSRACGEALAQEIRAGDVALIKGSQGIRMERVVERVLAERSRASELLVRQEKEWKNR